jgi:hypothetical protein
MASELLAGRLTLSALMNSHVGADGPHSSPFLMGWRSPVAAVDEQGLSGDPRRRR